MFANTEAFSGFAVDDLEAAKKFYGETLGIRTSEQYGLLTLHLPGGRDTLVYPKPGHVPATYTILNFRVDDIDAAVDELGAFHPICPSGLYPPTRARAQTTTM
jgi:catechol 2,3-dioxygenase-like lactoylglutathione lyase family enzyme